MSTQRSRFNSNVGIPIGQRSHSIDTKSTMLLSPTPEDLKLEAERQREATRKKQKDKLKSILSQVGSSKPPKTMEELENEKEQKLAEKRRIKEEKEKEK